jgi:signal transduction histidine kinase
VQSLRFTVDAALLRELGERLVGQPHIALAELIKNSYDADATRVEVLVASDRIEVVDDGTGMTEKQFRDFWMRIGSTHKSRSDISKKGRRLTGSKGVGRLAAQFLARDLELTTSSRSNRGSLSARVDWEQAAQAGDLTSAEAKVDFAGPPARFAGNKKTGTRLTLRRLHQTWDASALADLGRELWPLQPPFAAGPDEGGAFEVDLETADRAALKEFERSMKAVLRLWEARIVGRVERPDGSDGRRAVKVDVYFDDGDHATLELPHNLKRLGAVSFEIRVFRLQGRQRFGIPVDEAREYFRKFGGVHLYDAGFHLPYYGPETDWLGIEQDHAHRLSVSALLPDELQVEQGLRYLPTNSRLYGVVNVDSGAERRLGRTRRRARDVLTIQVSRDRLVDNAAFRELATVVRTSLDFYATRAALRAAERQDDEDDAAGQVLTAGATRLEDVIEEIRDELTPRSYSRLRRVVQDVGQAAETEAERMVRQAGLLGALASAGIAAVALEHETAREVRGIERLAKRLRSEDPDPSAAAEQLEQWVRRTRATRQLFRPLLDEESREEVGRYRARAVLEMVVEQASPLTRGLEVDLDDVPESFVLPPGRVSEWTALWQNVLINAANANTRVPDAVAHVRAHRQRRDHRIVMSDTGVGIDLAAADGLFEPFARVDLGSARSLGAGGTGLGLTIVRMIARNLNCQARFIEPEAPYNTAFELRWRTT